MLQQYYGENLLNSQTHKHIHSIYLIVIILRWKTINAYNTQWVWNEWTWFKLSIELALSITIAIASWSSFNINVFSLTTHYNYWQHSIGKKRQRRHKRVRTQQNQFQWKTELENVFRCDVLLLIYWLQADN